MSAYRTGFDSVSEAIEKAQSEANQGGGAINFFSWKDRDKKIIRFVDDAPITIGFHDYVLCADGKKRSFVCASQLAEPRECWICNNVTYQGKDGVNRPVRPRDKTIALAALREEHREGRTFEYRDVLTDVEVGDQEVLKQLKDAKIPMEGNTVKQIPTVGLVVQSVSNFWSQMNAYYSRWQTSCDRDYEITRNGEKLNTKYIAIPCEPVEGMKTEEEVAEHYLVATLTHPSVVDYIERLGSENYYESCLYPKKESSSDGNGAPAQSAQNIQHDAGASDSGPSESLSERLRSWKK